MAEFPDWLSNLDEFDGHVRDAVAGLPPNKRGAAFSRLAAVLLPSTAAGAGFSDIEQSEKQSYDGGVDAMSGLDADGRRLVIQSKLTLDTSKDIDSIVSYFEQYDSPRQADDALFELEAPEEAVSRFVVVSLSPLTQALKNYEASSLSSRKFYNKLRAEERIFFINGADLWQAARAEYARTYISPTEFTIYSTSDWLDIRDVRIGIVRGADIVGLYERYGEGIFYENIRSFLGLDRNSDRETVNRRILATIRETPSEFLARNNGITIRASKIDTLDDGGVRLRSPSIVNGCQTTMCLVEAGLSSQQAEVTVKIVESENAWEVTHSANYQNRVRQIDLDLAQFIRPQLVERVAANHGINLTEENRLQALLAQIQTSRLTYDDVKYMYRGLFSAHPNDLFENNYNKLRTEVVEVMHQGTDAPETTFESIFSLSIAGTKAYQAVRRQYSADDYRQFDRFERPAYRSFLTILAASGALRRDLDIIQPDAHLRAKAIHDFLASSEDLLRNDEALFNRSFLYAFQTLVDEGLGEIDESGDSRLGQRLHHAVTSAAFSKLYRKVLVRLDGDKANAG